MSGLNPNVMFELGMRLAFDRATVLIKDDATRYPFDTSPIEHVVYPRDLRYQKIQKFKDDLNTKVKKSLHAANSNEEYSPFLKTFGKFQTPNLDSESVPADEYLLEQVSELRREISELSARVKVNEPPLWTNALAAVQTKASDHFRPYLAEPDATLINVLAGHTRSIDNESDED